MHVGIFVNKYYIGSCYLSESSYGLWNVCTCLFSMEKFILMPTSVCVLNRQIPLIPGMVDGLGSQLLQRRQLYSGPMSKLRLLMICRMAKPEEVLIVEDENGNIVRETMKDNDVLVQYKVFNLYLKNKASNLYIYIC